MIAVIEKDALSGEANENPQVCTKIIYKGLEISIAMDSSHGAGDLNRSLIRVYETRVGGKDITRFVFPELAEYEEVYGTAENLRNSFAAIDEYVKTLIPNPMFKPKGEITCK